MSEDRPSGARGTTTEREEGRSPVRVHLADLMNWVMVAGLVAAACRAANPGRWSAAPLDVPSILGLAGAILAILMGSGLFRQAVARLRRRRAEGGMACLVLIGWRLAVVGLLMVAVVAEVRLLGSEVPSDAWSDAAMVRLRLLPLALILALAGIFAGLAPGRDRDRDQDQDRQRPGRMTGLAVMVAAGVGVLMATTEAVIPYLVLLAMNAVRNAMPGPAALQTLRPNLDARLLRAGVESVAVLACCLALGLLIARDLQRPAPPPGEVATARRGLVALLAATAAAGAGAAWLLASTLPRLDGWLADGLWAVVDPLNAAIVVLGFAGLALGLVARASDRPGRYGPDPPECRPRASYGRILGSSLIVLILLDVIAARAIDLIVVRRAIDGGPVDSSWTRWVGWVDTAFNWLQSVLPFRVSPWSLFEGPEWLALALLEVWVAVRVISLLVTSIGEEPSPIDAGLADRRTIGRFVSRWVALTVLMVASLPASFLTSLALLHILIRTSA